MSKRRISRRPTRVPESDRYFSWGYSMCRTPAFRSLSGTALKVLIELRCRFDGSNNGKISFAYQEAAELLHLSYGTVSRALDNLQKKGFIAVTRKGQWYGRQATLWRLTEKPCNGEMPTYDWKRWQPPKPPLDLSPTVTDMEPSARRATATKKRVLATVAARDDYRNGTKNRRWFHQSNRQS
jgi:hypothetical protein